MPEGLQPRGVTPLPRSGAVAKSARLRWRTNRTFVAQWTANKYTVTFDPNGGTGGWSRQMDYGTEIAAPTPTREGYVFNYWLRGRRGQDGTWDFS